MSAKSLDRAPRPRIPAAVVTALWATRPDLLLERCRERYGDTFALDLIGLGRVLFVSAPEDVRAVFTAPPSVALAGEGNGFLRAILGRHSLVTLDGPEHVRHRKLLIPPFHGERIPTYASIIVEATERALSRSPTGVPWPSLPAMQEITLEVIIRAVLGVEEPAARARFTKVFTDFAAIGNSPALLVPALRKDLGPSSPWGRVLAVRARADAALYAEFAQRRAALARDPAGESARADVLSLLLAARDESGAPMSDVELRDELVTLLLAGHETTATSLAWALELLAAHPSALSRTRDELDAALAPGARPTAKELAALPYLDGVVREALRLRPVLPNAARVMAERLEVAGYSLPKGAGVAPCIYLAHTRPASWSAPRAFSPERWLDTKTDPYAFFPFGGGGRRCLGMAFALYEMKAVLATILAKTDLSPCAPSPAPLRRRGITITPKGEGRVVLRPRASKLTPAR